MIRCRFGSCARVDCRWSKQYQPSVHKAGLNVATAKCTRSSLLNPVHWSCTSYLVPLDQVFTLTGAFIDPPPQGARCLHMLGAYVPRTRARRRACAASKPERAAHFAGLDEQIEGKEVLSSKRVESIPTNRSSWGHESYPQLSAVITIRPPTPTYSSCHHYHLGVAGSEGCRCEERPFIHSPIRNRRVREA